MIHGIMTVGGIGASPWAPGTVASGAALLLVLGWHVVLPNFGVYLALTILVTGLGYLAMRCSDPAWVNQDPSAIVIDEVAGQFVAFLPLSWGLAAGTLSLDLDLLVLSATAFGLFRLLDITKPLVIGWADDLKGPLGIMLDDVLAGAGTALGLVVIRVVIG